MKKTNSVFSLLITVNMLLQVFLSIPVQIRAVETDTTNETNVSFVSSVRLENQEGETSVKGEEGEEFYLIAEWKEQEKAAEKISIITLPNQLSVLKNKEEIIAKEQVVGKYQYEKNKIKLTSSRKVFPEGSVKIPVRLAEKTDSIVVDIDGTDYILFEADESSESSEEDEEGELAEKEEEQEEQEERVPAAEEEKEEVEKSGEHEDEKNDKEQPAEQEASKEQEIAPIREIGNDEIIFDKVTFTDANDKEFNADHPYDLRAAELGKLKIDWSLIKKHTVKAGDTYSFQLPSAFKPVSATSGELGSIGSWMVAESGKVTFTFDKNVEGDNVKGDFWFEIKLDKDHIDDSIDQEITFIDGPEYTVSFPVKPLKGTLISKKGIPYKEDSEAIGNVSSYNLTQAKWTIDLNTSLTQMSHPVIEDFIPENMEYVEGSLKIIPLKVSSKGDPVPEDTAMDSSRYGFDKEGNKIRIDLSGLTEEEAKKAYRIEYRTEVKEPEEGFSGEQSFTNQATLTSNGEKTTVTATIKSNYGKAVEKAAPTYDSNKQQFNWLINYNFNQRVIPQNQAELTDSWNPPNLMTLLEETIKVYPVSIDAEGKLTIAEEPLDQSEYGLNLTENGFKLVFNNQIDGQAYQIKYSTKILGNNGTEIVTEPGELTNKIMTGTGKESSSGGEWQQQGIVKSHHSTDVNKKEIRWQVQINKNGYTMENLVLTDTFSGDGLSLKKSGDKYEFKIVDQNGNEFNDYTLDYTVPEIGKPGDFTIRFNKTITQPLTLSYTTHFERNSNGTASYGNNAKIKWKTDSKEYESSSGEKTVTPGGYTAPNGVKYGSYNAAAKETTWTVNTNFARLPIEKDYTISDTLPVDQEYVDGSLTVYTYTIDQSGNIHRGGALEPETYKVKFPEGNTGTLEVTLTDAFFNKGEDAGTDSPVRKDPIGIEFKTKFADEWVRDDKVENTAVVTNGSEVSNLKATVSIPSGGTYADKTGKQAGAGNERIDWTVTLNPTQSRITDYTLIDTPDLNSVLLEDTFKLYKADVSKDGTVTPKGQALEKDKDYQLVINTNSETGEQNFELKIPGEITNAYVLKYSSYIDPLAPKDTVITNGYRATGKTIGEFDKEGEGKVKKINSGGGSGSSVRGGMTIKKTDESRNNSLSGAKFELYTKDGKQLLRSGITDEKGAVSFSGLRRGEYLLKEVSAPKDYVIDKALAEGKIIELKHNKDGEITSFTFTNARTKVTINKVDKDQNLIKKAATFTIFDKNGTVVRQNVMTQSGTVTIEELEPGTYYIEEQKAPEGYIRNPERVKFTIKINADGTQTIPVVKITNYKGSIEAVKKDQNNSILQGAVFKLEKSNGEIVASKLVSDKNGKIKVNDLAPGSYRLIETAAPEGYVRNTEELSFIIPEAVKGKPQIIYLNDYVNYQGSVRLNKTNSSGEALAGAVFEVRDENGKTVQAGKETDETGRLLVRNLAPGSYSFVEVKAPAGYVLDPTPLPFTIKGTAEGEPELISAGNAVNYQGAVEMKKTDSKGSPLQGAEFNLYEVLEESEERVLIGSSKSDKNGSVVVDNLAPGRYEFQEIKAPKGYIINTQSVPFTISKESAGKPVRVQAGALVNYQGEAILRKENAAGDALANAEFQIVDSEGNIARENLISDEEGLIEAEGLAPGSYFFQEVKAPTGYLLNTKTYEFVIEDSALGEPALVDVGTAVNYQGSVQWKKINEVDEPLSGAAFTITNEAGEKVVENLISNQDGIVKAEGLAPGSYTVQETKAADGYLLNTERKEFVILAEAEGEPAVLIEAYFVNYKGSVQIIKVNEQNEVLPNAVFELQTKDGKLLETITSDKYGKVKAEGLAPGDYQFVEVSSPDGFITNTEPIPFTIKSEAEGKPVIQNEGQAVNYQGSASLVKTDEDGKGLSGAEFELLDAEGTLVKKDLVSGQNGVVSVEDLAPGTYRFVETKAPEGYVRNEKTITFTIDARTPGKPKEIAAGTLVNYQGSVELTKKDEAGNGLTGAEFDLVDSSGTIVRSGLVTNENGEVTAEKLAPGMYELVETKAPAGYILNDVPLSFTIQAEAEGAPVSEKVEATNYKGSARLKKEDADGNGLAGAEFKVTDENSDEISRIVSNENGLIIADNLAPGKYSFEEISAPNGYIRNPIRIPFEIDAVQSSKPEEVVPEISTVVNYQGVAELTKQGKDANTRLAGAEFNLLNADLEVLNEEPFVTDEDGKITAEGLAPGTYYFAETKAPAGYIQNTDAVEFVIPEASKGQEAAEPVIVSVTMSNYQGSFLFTKVNEDKTPLAGAVFEIHDADGKVLHTIETDETGEVYVEGLEPGSYTITEKIAAPGYVRNTQIEEVTIPSQYSGAFTPINKGFFANYQGSASFKKVNEAGEPLAGAEFMLVDAKTLLPVQTGLLSNEEGIVTAKGLPEGTYRFAETKAPAGYVKNADLLPKFTIEASYGPLEVLVLKDFVNYQGSFKLVKTTEEGTPLADAIFELRGNGINLKDLKTDKNGEIIVTGLAPGAYELTETKAPTGYIRNTDPLPITIEETAIGKPAMQYSQAVNYRGSAELVKEDSAGNPLSGAEFNLLDQEGKGIVSGLITDEDGKIYVDGLSSGSYQFVETKAPAGYLLNTSAIPFEIEESAEGKPVAVSAGTFTNYQGSAVLKKENEDGQALAGAVFKVENENGEEIDTGLISDEKGLVKAVGLAPGNYRFVETEAPEGYILDSTPISFSIEEQAEGAPKQVQAGVFTNYQGSVQLTKVDFSDEEKTLSGAGFNLYAEDGSVIEEDLITDKNGFIQVEKLAPGSYYFIEVKAPAGYQLDQQKHLFNISANTVSPTLLKVKNKAIIPTDSENNGEKPEEQLPNTGFVSKHTFYSLLGFFLIASGVGIFYKGNRSGKEQE